MPDTSYRAVIFDLGGVVLDSPLPAIAAYETAAGLPPRLVARLVAEGGDAGPWARLERGELSAAAFAGAFATQARGAGHVVDGLRLLEGIEDATIPRESMLEAVGRLRAAGFRVAALTNAWDMPHRAGRMDQLRPRFDCFVESFRVRMRKPEPCIYEHVCQRLDVRPSAAIFLDDLGGNLKPARALGMTTIKVVDPAPALAELERLVGVPLTDRDGDP